ncbi:MAG: signal peptidase II [Planctomycetota bacterium]
MVDEVRGAGRASKPIPAAWFWGLVAGGVALDQITKVLVLWRFELGERIPVIPCFFYLAYVLNPGAAFGLGRSLGRAGPFFFVILNSLVIGLIVRIRAKTQAPAMRRLFDLGMGLVLAGALGNVIDRLHPPHKVIDFLDFWIGAPARGNWMHYPTFNLADIYIVVGVALYIWWAWRAEREVAGGGGGVRGQGT